MSVDRSSDEPTGGGVNCPGWQISILFSEIRVGVIYSTALNTDPRSPQQVSHSVQSEMLQYNINDITWYQVSFVVHVWLLQFKTGKHTK